MCISRFVESDSVTSSASVLDLVTIWCLHESASAGPASPMIRHAPVCDFPSGCTPYAASKYPDATMPRTPGVNRMPLPLESLKYFCTLHSFSASSCVALSTLVVRNASQKDKFLKKQIIQERYSEFYQEIRLN